MNKEFQRVLVVDDDVELREGVLLPGLRRYGFDPVGLGSAIELYKWLISNSCKLVILDIGLPDDDGFTIARHLRQTTSAGIIMVTGRDSKIDHMRGLHDGADMYFPKPVDVDLLASSLHSLARRMGLHDPSEPAAVADRWKLEADGWRLVSPNGSIIAMSLAERTVMSKLQAAEAPVPREDLINALCDVIADFDPSRLEMVVHRLRKKVETKAGQELPLSAVRRMGYMLST